MSPPTEHPAAWTRLDVPEGLGIGTLITEPDGYRLEAGETVADGGDRFACRFTVRTDLAWVTLGARVEVLSAGGVEVVELGCRNGHWTVAGRSARDLVGCVDVDVASTPVTNTLPIRRLGLRPGEYRDIAVAWIDVPSLRVRRVKQRYTRLKAAGGLDRYVYRSPEHGEYELSVDRSGLVVDYERFARRLG